MTEYKPLTPNFRLDINIFTEELQVLLNNSGIDTICNTPDYILAEYLTSCLETYANTVQSRDTWFGFKPFSRHKVEPQEREDI